MELGDRHLKVVRASIGITQASGLDMGVNAMSMFAKTTSQDLETSRVLQLLNMVTAEELMDNDDYEGKSQAVPLVLVPGCLTVSRDLRGRARGVPEIREGPRVEGAPSYRWQPAVFRGGKDLCQIRHHRVDDCGAEGARGKEIRRPNCGHDLLLGGEPYITEIPVETLLTSIGKFRRECVVEVSGHVQT